jgi:hypothetical protein
VYEQAVLCFSRCLVNGKGEQSSNWSLVAHIYGKCIARTMKPPFQERRFERKHFSTGKKKKKGKKKQHPHCHMFSSSIGSNMSSGYSEPRTRMLKQTASVCHLKKKKKRRRGRIQTIFHFLDTVSHHAHLLDNFTVWWQAQDHIACKERVRD